MIPRQNPKVKYRPLVLTDFEIFTRIWIQPGNVLGYINEYRYDSYTLALLLITAIATSLELAVIVSIGEQLTFAVLLSVCVFLGGLLGLILFYIYAAVVNWTGEWFDGLGSTNALIRVFAYAMFPMTFVLIFVIAKILVFGDELFDERMNLASFRSELAAFYIIASTIEITLAIWAIYLAVVGVSQAQRISPVKSLLNVAISALIIAAVVGVLALPFVS